MTYSATGLPSGLSIAATTGLISGTVGFDATATNSVTVTVNDGKGGTVSATFSLADDEHEPRADDHEPGHAAGGGGGDDDHAAADRGQ